MQEQINFSPLSIVGCSVLLIYLISSYFIPHYSIEISFTVFDIIMSY